MKKNINFEDNMEITDDNKNVLDINTFTKFLKAVQDSSNLESHKTLFLYSVHLFK